jgi:hypothetical protein
LNPINWSKSKKSKKPDVREWFSRFFRVFFRKPDKYDRNCPLLWKTPADRKSFEIIKTLAIRRLHYYYYMDDEEESLIKKEIIDIKDQPKDAGCSFFSDLI